VLQSVASAVVASGHFLVPRVGGLFAVPFDVDTLQLTGDAVRLADEVVWDPPNGLVSVAAVDAGVMAFRPAGRRALQFEWLDATGKSLGTVGPPDVYGAFSLSPDGTRIVVRLLPSQAYPEGALRLIDITRGVVSPIVTPPGLASDPIWTPDGARILYRLGARLMRQSPFSTDAETIRDETWFPDALSADSRWLLAGRPEAIGGFGLFVLEGSGAGEPKPLDVGAISDEASFSPDGTLVAFHSNRTGRSEVYLTPFPQSDERWQVSPAGAVQPRWSADGRWLYYLDLTGTLQRAAIAPDTPGRIGRSETVMDLGIGLPSNTIEQWAPHRDRVLVLRPVKDGSRESIVVLSNWTTLLPPAERK
jgi:Tol biopolymer transport system component